MNTNVLDGTIQQVRDELLRAMALHAPMHSAHEAYAVILEELDEFWEQCRKRRSMRDEDNMRVELVQIAAMAIRAIHDLHLAKGNDLTGIKETV